LTRSQEGPPAWSLLHARVIGTSHAATGTPCQDCVAICTTNLGIIIGAVSDGLGSARNSGIGAEVAVAAAIDTLRAHLSSVACPSDAEVGLLLQTVLDTVHGRLCERALQDQQPIAEYACTLIVVAATESWIFAMGIGDGFLVVRFSDDNAFTVLLHPNRGEFVNETYSVASATLANGQIAICRRPPHSIIGSSDGLLDLALSPTSWEPHQPFFAFVEESAASWTNESLEAFLNDPEVNRRTTDDKCLLCVVQVEKIRGDVLSDGIGKSVSSTGASSETLESNP
jgi:protein phosphatase 2C-like protein